MISRRSAILGAGILAVGLGLPLAASASHNNDEALAFVMGTAVGYAAGDRSSHLQYVHRRHYDPPRWGHRQHRRWHRWDHRRHHWDNPWRRHHRYDHRRHHGHHFDRDRRDWHRDARRRDDHHRDHHRGHRRGWDD